jgi:hypothetical protein
VFQSIVRTLPSHDKDTLLVFGTSKRGTLDQSLGTSEWRSASADGERSAPSLPSVQAHFVSTSKYAGLPHPTDVSSLSTGVYKQEVTEHLASRCNEAKLVRFFSPDARAQKILKAQNPASVSKFRISGTESSELLPGEAPILDHAIAALSSSPGWENTLKTLKKFTKLRVPDPDRLPDVMELVIGNCTRDDILKAIRWIDFKHEETKDELGFCIPALDVENIAVAFDAGKEWSDLTTDVLLHQKLKGVIDGFHPNNSAKCNFPVLLMYGSVGWQLHIRILVNYERVGQRTQITVPEATVDEELLAELFGHFLPPVGTGIENDIDSFLQAINCVCYTKLTSKQLPKGIPLSNLTRLCGVSHSQSSLAWLVYLVLGGILPKDWRCSVAGHKWGKPVDELPDGLKAYLAGDIQQVSVAASVLSIVWVSHLIPDAQNIRDLLQMDPLNFIAVWLEKVFRSEINLLSSFYQDNSLPTTRELLLTRAGLTPNSEYSLLSLCPPWPSITSGGPKSLAETKTFSSNAISQFVTLYLVQPLSEPAIKEEVASDEPPPRAPTMDAGDDLGPGGSRGYVCPYCSKGIWSKNYFDDHV